MTTAASLAAEFNITLLIFRRCVDLENAAQSNTTESPNFSAIQSVLSVWRSPVISLLTFPNATLKVITEGKNIVRVGLVKTVTSNRADDPEFFFP